MEQVENTFNDWIGHQTAFTYHPLDMQRFYKFVDAATASDEYIDGEWLKDRLNGIEHRGTKDQVEEFAQKLDIISDYIKR